MSLLRDVSQTVVSSALLEILRLMCQARDNRLLQSKTGKETEVPKCDPTTINLADYPQWAAEKGYWIGEYTFLQGDGTPNASPSWPYPYDSYKGFITGNIKGLV